MSDFFGGTVKNMKTLLRRALVLIFVAEVVLSSAPVIATAPTQRAIQRWGKRWHSRTWPRRKYRK
jgi:hypothetical protein